jgi:aminoglycoside phosphotransferase (APT) family kinase protein
MHVAAPADAPRSSYRGVALASRRADIEVRVRRLAQHGAPLPTEALRIWEQALTTPIDISATWLHADLHPRNILISRGKFSGVVDWGDACIGDAATDLASIWMVLNDRDARSAALHAYGPSSIATLTRSKGWAIFFAVIFADTGLAGDRGHREMSHRILQNVIDGP